MTFRFPLFYLLSSHNIIIFYPSLCLYLPTDHREHGEGADGGRIFVRVPRPHPGEGKGHPDDVLRQDPLRRQDLERIQCVVCVCQ